MKITMKTILFTIVLGSVSGSCLNQVNSEKRSLRDVNPTTIYEEDAPSYYTLDNIPVHWAPVKRRRCKIDYSVDSNVKENSVEIIVLDDKNKPCEKLVIYPEDLSFLRDRSITFDEQRPSIPLCAEDISFSDDSGETEAISLNSTKLQGELVSVDHSFELETDSSDNCKNHTSDNLVSDMSSFES